MSRPVMRQGRSLYRTRVRKPYVIAYSLATLPQALMDVFSASINNNIKASRGWELRKDKVLFVSERINVL